MTIVLSSCVTVGNGSKIPISKYVGSILLSSNPYPTLSFIHVLITPHIIKNPIYVRHFIRDKKCSIKFDKLGFLVKDYQTRQNLLKCDSMDDLYCCY